MTIRAETSRESGARACMWLVLLAPLGSHRASSSAGNVPSSFFKKTHPQTPKPGQFLGDRLALTYVSSLSLMCQAPFLPTM